MGTQSLLNRLGVDKILVCDNIAVGKKESNTRV